MKSVHEQVWKDLIERQDFVVKSQTVFYIYDDCEEDILNEVWRRTVDEYMVICDEVDSKV